MTYRFRERMFRLPATLVAVSLLAAFAAIGGHVHAFTGPTDAPRIDDRGKDSSPSPSCWSCALAHSPARATILCVGDAPSVQAGAATDADQHQIRDALSRSLSSRGPPSLP